MKKKIKIYELILSLFILGIISFIFLRCHEITSQQIAAMTIILVVIQPNKLFCSKGKFKGIVFVLLVYILLEAVISLRRYGQGISIVGYYCFGLLSLLLYFYFTGIKNCENNLFTDILKGSRVLLGWMYIVAVLAYMGIYILDDYAYRTRGGLFRINAGDYLIVIGILLTFGKLLECRNVGEKTSQRDIIWFSLGIFYIIFISQTRMQLLACAIAIILTYLIARKDKSKKIIIIGIISLIIILLIQIPAIQNILYNNFGGLFNGTDASMVPRIGAIEHYINYGNQKSLMGWGYASVSAPSNGRYDLFNIFRGPWGTYYTDDVGIFSYYMMYGVIGVILLIILLVKMVKFALVERYKEPHRMALVLFVLITSLSLSLFDVERQSYLVLILLCMESQCKKRKSGQDDI